MIKGTTEVKFLGFSRGGKHIWVEYLSGDRKGLILRKPASIIPTGEEKEWIKAQELLNPGKTLTQEDYIKAHQYNA